MIPLLLNTSDIECFGYQKQFSPFFFLTLLTNTIATLLNLILIEREIILRLTMISANNAIQARNVSASCDITVLAKDKIFVLYTDIFLITFKNSLSSDSDYSLL